MKKLFLTTLLAAALAVAGCGSKPAETPNPTGQEKPAAQAPAAQTPAPAPAESKGTKYGASDKSKASYKVNETFLGNQLNVDAVGTTTEFKGEIILDNGVIQPSVVQVNLHNLTSDEARRDRQVRSALDTGNHPYATFTIAGAEGNPVLKDGQETPVKLTGKMTIKGTEKNVVWDGVAKLSGDTLTLNAQTRFKMTEFGVKPPSIAGFVSVVDETTLIVEYVGTKQ